ncbi:thiamine biosynthetic bifunctional enzyme Thi4 [Amanita muscaria]
MPIVVDYSLYLVSGRSLLPPGKEFLASLEEAIQGGVTAVQIREKDAETYDFLQIAASSKSLCDKYGVPLIINDRVDVALAVKAHGVHLGQTDMPVAIARQLLPPGTVIGVSCNTVEHVKRAVEEGVDYVGIGPVWATTTKKLTNPVIGVRGVGAMLEVLDGTGIKAVAIGGIKTFNLLRTLYGSVSRTGHTLDGIAVVSEIMASPLPTQVAETMRKTFDAFQESYRAQLSRPTQGLWANSTTQSVVRGVCELMEHVRKTAPLVHQITNTVVATQSANITLALGASPIMATEAQEMEDLSSIAGAHLINIGTLRAEYKSGMIKAGYFANANRKPIVFDPVGVGASQFRKETVKELLDTFQVSAIKGNAGELSVLAESNEVSSKGVDSVGGFQDPVSFVRELAKKERCIVVLTGKTDYVSDGERVVALDNGHEILGKITGSGCIVGTAIATYCAASSTREGNDSSATSKLVGGDMLLGAVAGILVLTIASQLAAEREGIKGPGTFLSGLIDVLWDLTADDIARLAMVQLYTD